MLKYMFARNVLALLSAIATASVALPAGARMPELTVASNGHYFTTKNGKPFFWMGDTAWEMIHAATRDEIDYYLTTRAREGFTIVQTVVLAENDGVRKATPEGYLPFDGGNPQKPNSVYFDKVAYAVKRADDLGLYVALLPTWGDKVADMWGAGPRLFTENNLPEAEAYGRYLGTRLKSYSNIVWMLGGDRPAHNNGANWEPVWAAMAKGIANGCGCKPLIAYHPMGGVRTSQDLSDAKWLDVNGTQSGSGAGHDVPVWEGITEDFNKASPKPTLDLETNYEDHPYNPVPRWDASNGYFTDYDVRKQTYRSVFAGAAGVTYGHNSVWCFDGGRNDVNNHSAMDWKNGLQRPAGREMAFLRFLIESRPQLSRIPDNQLIISGQDYGGLHLEATRDSAGTYAFVYFPLNDRKATIDLTRLTGKSFRATWYDPRTGIGTSLGTFSNQKILDVQTPPTGPDWVLVLDSTEAGYPMPGLQ